MNSLTVAPEPAQPARVSAASDPVGPNPAAGKSAHADYSRDSINIRLGALGPRLRALAVRENTTVSALMRRATVQMLRERLDAIDPDAYTSPPDRGPWGRVSLKLPQAQAAALVARAREADMSRSEFVWSLLIGKSPPPAPPDLASAVRALLSSTDRIAVLSTDLSEFLRLLVQFGTSAPQLQALRESMRSLHTDVREHMKRASLLMAALKPYRKPRP